MSSHLRSTLRRRRVVGATLPLAAGAALLLGLTGCAGSSTDPAEAAEPTVVVSDAWVRATVGTKDPSMTGAFMSLDNEGTENVTLTGASSPVAGKVELHEMAMVDGAMVMRKVDGGIEIEAGYGQALMPGGNHVMLMDLSRKLAPGDEVELVLEFSDGTSEDLTVPVKEFTEEQAHYHAPGTGHSSPTGGASKGMSMSPSETAAP